MFLSGVLSGATIHQTDPDEERDPPPEATPVTFPSVEPPKSRTWTPESPPPDLQLLFTKLLKPTDVSEAHLRALNIDLQPQCSAEELLPLAPDGSSYLPVLSTVELPTSTASYADATKADPGPSRKRKEFDDRLAELRLENALAYRTVMRNFKQGVKPPKLAYMRTFWQGLESMSQYWDCTLDQYYATNDSDDAREKSPKRQKLGTDSSDADNTLDGSEATATLPMRTTSDGTPIQDNVTTGSNPSEADPTHGMEESKDVATTPLALQPSVRYKGLRTNSGRYMPDQFRAEAIRGFVEGTVWPFQCNVSPPRMMPLVQVNKLKIPVRQTAAVYRLPKDRARAREGGIVGPVLGVQVRPEIEFRDDEQGKARLDVLRELGGLLQVAQERAREGKQEVKPGEGEWWTTVPRWGGGPGGEVQNDGGNSDVVQAVQEPPEPGAQGGGSRSRRSKQKKTPAMLWKELKPGSGGFDPKTDYAAIGKTPGSDVDEIFLLSSLNHHIALLKLTVHAAYLEHLLSPTTPAGPLPADARWCRPSVQRTRWFDLFVEADRVEAFRGLWGVMAYLTREAEGGGGGGGKGGGT